MDYPVIFKFSAILEIILTLFFLIFMAYVIAATGPSYFDKGSFVVIFAYALFMIARSGSVMLIEYERKGQ